jgi:hypothetical protein
MMRVGSLSSFQVEQPKDDNNFNKVDIERKIGKKEKRNKTYKQRNKRERLHAKRKLMCTQKERELMHKENHVFLVYNKQVHKVIMRILHQLEKLFKIVAQQCKCRET